MTDNTIQERGFGTWCFRLYKPEDDLTFYATGFLKISSSYHWVMDKIDGIEKTIIHVPNQNVAVVYDTELVEK